MPATSIFLQLLAASTTFALSIDKRAPASIDAAFKARGKDYWGTCGDSNTLSISQNGDIVKADFGQITPENAMKWWVNAE
jgi:endo-1,4-beta-xylanase